MADTTTERRSARLRLQLLGRFALHTPHAVSITAAGQRLLAAVALHGGIVDRPRLAGTLWPTCGSDRALANVRSALWRLPEPVRRYLDTRGAAISFDPSWSVDVDRVVDAARKVYDCDAGVDAGLFAADILPDWDHPWLAVPRERHRQLRLHALEDLAAAQLSAGRPLDAVDTILRAVAAEPLRESAQLLLLRAHLAAGNRAAVLRAYERFERLLDAELGLAPGPAMQQLQARVTPVA